MRPIQRVMTAVFVLGGMLLLPPAGTAQTQPEAEAVIIPHRQNFFLYSQDSQTREDRQFVEIKFQLSFKVEAFRAWEVPVYFGYTQKSFWQVFDDENSSPFRENNYNPEAFLVLGEKQDYSLQAGVEHESNGQPMPRSRSWNRTYLWPRIQLNQLEIGQKLWYRWNEPPKNDPLVDPEGDDNPDIEDFMGKGEFYLKYRLPSQWIHLMVRKGFKDENGTLQLDYQVRFNAITGFLFDWRPLSNVSHLHLHYFHGYGESLADYNILMKKTAIGISINL